MDKNDKINVFLDSSVIFSYLLGKEETKELFSKKILKKAKYLISPIILQEVLLATQYMEKKDLQSAQACLKLVDKSTKIITADNYDIDLKRLQWLRNHIAHSNDILILQTALNNCNYFVTLDDDLLRIEKLDSLKIISPHRYFQLMEESQ